MRLLNSLQAVAAYSAMCCLNTVGAKIHVRIKSGLTSPTIHIKEDSAGRIQVWRGDDVGNPTSGYEQYGNQTAFAEAYKV